MTALEGVNLQDLSNASESQLQAAGALVWEIKSLFATLIKGKVSGALATIEAPTGDGATPARVADLTAALPRDVVLSAQRQWLPMLAKELEGRAAESATGKSEKKPDAKPKPGPDASEKALRPGSQTFWFGRSPGSSEPLLRLVAADGADADESGAIKKRWTLPSGTPRSIDQDRRQDEGGDAGDTETPRPRAPKGPAGQVEKPGNADAASPTSNQVPAAPEASSAEQTDDLLLPSESELEAIKSGKPMPSVAGSTAGSATAGASSPAPAKPDAAVAALKRHRTRHHLRRLARQRPVLP